MTSTETQLACRECGSTELYAWYAVDERQGLILDGVRDDGSVEFDYNGVTRSGDVRENDEYRCASCDACSTSLEYLVGVLDAEPVADVEIEIEAMAPEALALPSAEVRWYLTGRHTHGELVRIEGARDAVEAFVRLHWGDEEFEQFTSAGEFFAVYATTKEV